MKFKHLVQDYLCVAMKEGQLNILSETLELGNNMAQINE